MQYRAQALLLSPLAGAARRGIAEDRGRLEDIAAEHGFRVDIAESVAALREIVAEWHRDGIDTVAVHGGDGTISHILTQLMRVYPWEHLPQIAILGGGTINVLARRLGHLRQPSRHLRALIGRQHHLVSEWRPLVVNGRCGFVFAAVGATRFLERFSALPRRSEMIAVRHLLELAARGLVRGNKDAWFRETFAPESVRIEGRDASTSVIIAAGGWHGILHVVPSHLRPWPLMRAGLRIMRGLEREGQAFENLTLSGSLPWRYTLDGDICEAKTGIVRLELGPRFRFMALGSGRGH